MNKHITAERVGDSWVVHVIERVVLKDEKEVRALLRKHKLKIDKIASSDKKIITKPA